MARLLLGPGRGRRRPHRARVRRSLHQPAGGEPHHEHLRAAEALILLVAVLTVSVFVLVPGQGAGLLGAEVLVVGLAACGWIAAIQLPRLREWGTMRADLRVSFVLRVVLGQVATLTLVIAGVAVLWVGPGGLYWLVASTVFSILAALADAWVLLVEINR